MQVSKPKKGYKFVDVRFGKFEEIPEDWNIHNFKDFVSLKHGFAFDSNDFIDGDGIKVVKIGDIQKDGSVNNENLDKVSITIAKKIEEFTVLDEDILMALTGATLGKTGVVKTDEKLLQNQRVGNFFPIDKDVLDKKFLFFVLRSDFIQNQIWSFVSSSAQPNIGKSELGRIKFFKPEKLLEQQKISTILLNVDNTLEKINQLIQKTESLKKGLMQKLLTKGIGHTKFNNVEWFFGKEIEIPEEWEIKILDKIAKRGSGHTPDAKITNYYNGGIKWISLADSKKLDNIFIYETEKEISHDGIKHSSAVIHPRGTVLLSRDAGVGKSAIMATEMAVSQHFITWNCSENLNNHFLYYTLQFLKPIFERIATGTTILTIGLPFFKKMKIALPDIAEQKQIATILSNVDSLIIKEKLQKSSLTRLKRGLMQNLLTGKIRVKF